MNGKRTAEQELVLAAEIQASFLPRSLPALPGWDLDVTLRPARLTCGDFYDVIPLSNGRIGLVMADVADKGAGAALFMALSRTLIRTFAILHANRPDLALAGANGRILQDTDSDLFVTVFLGVLEPRTGTLSYVNAGHNPPYLLRRDPAAEIMALGQTGIPLGISAGKRKWRQRQVQIAPGDVLLLYTDGIPEAHTAQNELFGTERLLGAAQTKQTAAAMEIRRAIMTAVDGFVADAPQFDDIAMMILKRVQVD